MIFSNYFFLWNGNFQFHWIHNDGNNFVLEFLLSTNLKLYIIYSLFCTFEYDLEQCGKKGDIFLKHFDHSRDKLKWCHLVRVSNREVNSRGLKRFFKVCAYIVWQHWYHMQKGALENFFIVSQRRRGDSQKLNSWHLALIINAMLKLSFTTGPISFTSLKADLPSK